VVTKQIVVKGEKMPPFPVGRTDRFWQTLKGHCVSAPFEIDESTIKVEVDCLEGFEYYFRLLAEERGGGATNTGSATIICGDNGEPLKPYRTPRRGSLSQGVHAVFATSKPIIEIVVDHHRQDFTVVIYSYSINGTNGEVKKFTVWNLGTMADASAEEVLDSLPDYVDKYRQALQAALNKAVEYHCREPYYYTLEVK